MHIIECPSPLYFLFLYKHYLNSVVMHIVPSRITWNNIQRAQSDTYKKKMYMMP